MEELEEVVAHRSNTLLYPASRGNIGHTYYINQRTSPGVDPDDGGYIIDQLGA